MSTQCRVCDREFTPMADADGFTPSRCARCITLASLRIAAAALDRAKAWQPADAVQEARRRDVR